MPANRRPRPHRRSTRFWGCPAGTLASNINIYANRPYSKKLNQADLDADYAVAKGQALRGDLRIPTDRPQVRRLVDQLRRCAKNVRKTRCARNGAPTPSKTFSSRLSYAYSQRRVNYDPNAWLALVPMANFIPSGGATESVSAFLAQSGLTGFGPVAPWVPLQPGNLGIYFPNNSSLVQTFYGSRNDIHELIGMRPIQHG